MSWFQSNSACFKGAEQQDIVGRRRAYKDAVEIVKGSLYWSGEKKAQIFLLFLTLFLYNSLFNIIMSRLLENYAIQILEHGLKRSEKKKLLPLPFTSQSFDQKYITVSTKIIANVSWAPNHPIIMISEGSCDIKHWSNGCWKFSFEFTIINDILKYIKNESYFKL